MQNALQDQMTLLNRRDWGRPVESRFHRDGPGQPHGQR